MRTVSAADANRHFSSMLREVAMGKVVTVLSRGKPVATIAPVRLKSEQRLSAKRALLARLSQQKALGKRSWSRDQLYAA